MVSNDLRTGDPSRLQLQIGHSTQQSLEGDLALEPSQRRAEAEVAGPGEGDVPVIRYPHYLPIVAKIKP